METKKNIVLKLLSAFLSIIVSVLCFYIYYKRITRFFYLPILTINIILIFVMFTIILYKYILTILKNISNKKIIKALLLLILLIFAIVIAWFIKDNVNYILRNIILMLIFIFGVVCFPIIILGMVIIGDEKRKISKTVIVVGITIFIYFVNYSQVLDYAKKIIIDLSSYSLNEIFVLRGHSSNTNISIDEKNNIDRSYLYNYSQVYEKQGYLDKYDITQILSIADSKSSLTYINYKDENRKLSITNKEDEKVKELIESLEGNYYKFNYEAKGIETTINIEKYVVEQPKSNERNEDIILYGIKNKEIIKNINKTISEQYFFIKNELVGEKREDMNLQGFKLLVVYDEEEKNFIPAVSNQEEYNFINSYSVTNDLISVTLNKGVTINNSEYTIRINRYNNELKLPEFQRITYVYNYEPVVTQTYDSENRLVLDFEFKNTYAKEALENIEIILGK